MRTKPQVWVVSVAAGVLAIPAVYALLRAYEVVFKSEPDPSKVVWQPHIGMFWRCGVSAYAAGMLAVLTFMAARADLPRTARGLSVLVVVVGLMIGLQGLFAP